jgi:hypothetical protein
MLSLLAVRCGWDVRAVLAVTLVVCKVVFGAKSSDEVIGPRESNIAAKMLPAIEFECVLRKKGCLDADL